MECGHAAHEASVEIGKPLRLPAAGWRAGIKRVILGGECDQRSGWPTQARRQLLDPVIVEHAVEPVFGGPVEIGRPFNVEIEIVAQPRPRILGGSPAASRSLKARRSERVA